MDGERSTETSLGAVDRLQMYSRFLGSKGLLPPRIEGRVAVVGICASGKSTLVDRLQGAGYDARSCAQEHSHVPDMWRRLSRPEVLIYLDASLPVIRQRNGVRYEGAYIQRQRERLRHAREHCDLYIQTDDLSPEEVFAKACRGVERAGVTARDG